MLALQVHTQEPFASVKWFKDNEEIKMTRKRNQRLKIVSQDTYHILAIEKCIGSDRGEYSVSTNTETSNCTVSIKEYPHKFIKGFEDTTIVTEGNKLELEVSVEDENAEVKWFLEDNEIKPEKSRYLNESNESLNVLMNVRKSVFVLPNV